MGFVRFTPFASADAPVCRSRAACPMRRMARRNRQHDTKGLVQARVEGLGALEQRMAVRLMVGMTV